MKADISEPALKTAIDALNWSDARTNAKASAAEKRAEARAKGYEGEACGECGNFTLVRNGTCMKCDTCGSTTGCS
jgi:ribonucleoside-diphosphate reductase alpha chain